MNNMLDNIASNTKDEKYLYWFYLSELNYIYIQGEIIFTYKEKSKKATQGTKDEETLNDDDDRR